MGYQTPGFDVTVSDPDLVAWWRDLLAKHDRIAIAGGPRTGKSTLAKTTEDRPVFYSDDFKEQGMAWADIPDAMLAAVKDEARFVIEGVQVARALRKGMVVDAVAVLHEARLERNAGQEAMTKGVHTVLASFDLDVPRYEWGRP